ncbi:MAG: L-ribulose-5-phosphate 4-epimerase AraD [Clostridiales bacterium]|nr:L-ribulose-5-phosphate 4-epimerase AraD [Clostridiales bacterium]
MKIIITGVSGGIGRAVASRFLAAGHEVYGIDLLPAALSGPGYTHFTADIKDPGALPEITDADILFNNAGTQNGPDDIGDNLRGTVNVTEKYILSCPGLRSVLFNASSSSLNGQEFPEYAASKAGVVGYMKNVAIRLAPRGVTVNAISPGGVLTRLNDPVTGDPESWKKIMEVTPLKKWMTADEVADWVLFLTLQNRSMSGQNLLIDNGEQDLNPRFVWPETCPGGTAAGDMKDKKGGREAAEPCEAAHSLFAGLKKEVCRANLRLAEEGLVILTWGNVSKIDRERGAVCIKPSGVPYAGMKPEDMVVVDMEGNVIEGSLRPSSDTDTHLELYRRFPGIGSVVHTHSTYATAFAQAKRPVRIYGTTHADAFAGDIPCTRDLTDEEIGGRYELATGQVIAETFETRGIDPLSVPAVLVSGHGPFAWGRNEKAAVDTAVTLEETAKMALLTERIDPSAERAGEAIIKKHYLRKHGKNATYGQG